jgi:hypothetical protein
MSATLGYLDGINGGDVAYGYALTKKTIHQIFRLNEARNFLTSATDQKGRKEKSRLRTSSLALLPVQSGCCEWGYIFFTCTLIERRETFLTACHHANVEQ